ncbi:MAG: hypothetical protein ACFB21_08210 [Opitutales bacterium]
MGWIFFGVLVVLFVVVTATAIANEKKRRRELERLAGDLSLEYKGDAGGPEYLGLDTLPHFRRGRSRRAYNLMQGKLADAEVMLFDYRYRTGSGKNSSTHHQTLAAFEVPAGGLPTFQCEPEHFFHALGEMLGFHDIDFPRFPEFSRSYRLKGDDEAAVRELFHDEAIRWLEHRRSQHWRVQGGSRWLIAFRKQTRLKTEEWPQFYLEATELLNVITLPWQQRR